MAPKAVKLLQLSPTMTEGTIVKWLVKEGDHVEDGQVIAEIETDKAVMEQTSFEEGTILKLSVAEGQKVAVESVIAVVGEPGEDASSASAAKPAAAPKSAAPVAAAATPAPAAAAPAAPAPAAVAAAPAPEGRLVASPLARKMAKDAGLDLAAVSGSGPNGRIVKADVEAAVAGGAKPAVAAPAAAAVAPAPAAAPAPRIAITAPVAEEIMLSGMRQTIARRLVESKQQVPHFQLSIDVRAEKLLDAVNRVRAVNPDAKVTVTHFLIKAMANVQVRHRAIRSQFGGDRLHVIEGAHISVAVAIEDGLVTPVIRNADRKGVLQIATDLKVLVGKARDRKLTVEEMTGGTQTISNLGMFGVASFTAIINPPESSILAIGATEDRPVVENGQIVPGKVMTITASFDHRVIDGAVGAQFLADLKKALEDPLMMLL